MYIIIIYYNYNIYYFCKYWKIEYLLVDLSEFEGCENLWWEMKNNLKILVDGYSNRKRLEKLKT